MAIRFAAFQDMQTVFLHGGLHGNIRVILVSKYVQVVDFVYTDVIYAWGKRHDIGQMRCDYASQTAARQQLAFVTPSACHQQALL